MKIHSYVSSGGKDLIMDYIMNLTEDEKVDGLPVMDLFCRRIAQTGDGSYNGREPGSIHEGNGRLRWKKPYWCSYGKRSFTGTVPFGRGSIPALRRRAGKGHHTTMNKQKMTAKEIFSIPNLMGYFRILLIPVFSWIYIHADGV